MNLRNWLSVHSKHGEPSETWVAGQHQERRAHLSTCDLTLSSCHSRTLILLKSVRANVLAHEALSLRTAWGTLERTLYSSTGSRHCAEKVCEKCRDFRHSGSRVQWSCRRGTAVIPVFVLALLPHLGRVECHWHRRYTVPAGPGLVFF